MGPLLLLVALLTPACANQSAQQRRSNDMEAVGVGGPVTFYSDVLPILTSSKPGVNYRCTVCHASYADYSQVSKPAVASAILDSIATHRMPLTGDPVTSKDVEVIRAWVAGGLLAGQPVLQNAKPNSP